MKIAMVLGDYDAYGGGAERWTDRHARRLIKRGHEIHLFSRRFRGAPDVAICHLVPPGGAWGRRRIGFGRQAEHILRDGQYDVIHDMGDGWFADIIMPHHGTRKGSLEQNLKLVPPSIRWLRRISYPLIPRYREFHALESRKYDGRPETIYIAVSQMVRENMHRYHAVPYEKIRVIYNGVNIDRFKPSTDDALRLNTRQELGVGEDETLFLLVAHNFRLKGIESLILSISTMSREGKRVRLLVVGDGNISKYERMARVIGCHQMVRFVGDQPDPMTYYHAADVFMLPTFYDPCSLVVLEAMACGLPVITTRRNGVHELMGQGREGFILADPEDVESLVKYMTVYLDKDARQAAGCCARNLAETYSMKRNCDEHVGVYEEVIQTRQRAS